MIIQFYDFLLSYRMSERETAPDFVKKIFEITSLKMFGSTRKFKLILLAVNLILCALGLIIIGISAWLLIKPDYVFNIVLENNGQENRDYIKMARQKV